MTTRALGTRKAINLSNAHLARVALRSFDAATAEFVAWATSPCTVQISATATGAAIANLGPFSMSLAAGDNSFYYTFSAAILDAALNSSEYIDKDVYQVVIAGPSNEYRGVTPLRVTVPRYVE